MKILLYCVFYLSIFLPIFTYIFYPIVLKILTLYKNKIYKVDTYYRPKVSVLIAAYNEEKIIEEKILNLLNLDYPKEKIEFIIGSDGSNDRTLDILKKYVFLSNFKVLDLKRGGKVNVLNHLIKEANGEILVFSDANTMFDSMAIKELVKFFVDTNIGCVSGQLRYKVDKSSGVGAKSESSYWKYENYIKILESKLGRLSGANGAIYSIRKNLVNKMQKNIINDDFFISTNIMQQGYDVIMNTKAKAYEEPNDNFESQFIRHIRDGAGHYQAIVIFWKMLFFRKGSFVYFSHRILRWLVPFFLILAFVSNIFLIGDLAFFNIFFGLQLFVYLGLLIYYFFYLKKGITIKYINLIFYFFSVNLSLFIGFVQLIKKQQKSTWETQR